MAKGRGLTKKKLYPDDKTFIWRSHLYPNEKSTLNRHQKMMGKYPHTFL